MNQDPIADGVTVEPMRGGHTFGKPAYTLGNQQLLVSVIESYTTEELLDRALETGPDSLYVHLWADRVARGMFTDPDKKAWR